MEPQAYREGAKGHCFWCGRSEVEHKGGVCPEFLGPRRVTDLGTKSPKTEKIRSRAYGLGVVR